jgi:hypothetical protein
MFSNSLAAITAARQHQEAACTLVLLLPNFTGSIVM